MINYKRLDQLQETNEFQELDPHIEYTCTKTNPATGTAACARLGTCPPGQKCETITLQGDDGNPVQSCECINIPAPTPTPCSSSVPACNGKCPTEEEECIPVNGPYLICSCQPKRPNPYPNCPNCPKL